MMTNLKRLFFFASFCSLFSTVGLFYTYIQIENSLDSLATLQINTHNKVLDIEEYMVPKEVRDTASSFEQPDDLDN